jgi:hypothetical protein
VLILPIAARSFSTTEARTWRTLRSFPGAGRTLYIGVTSNLYLRRLGRGHFHWGSRCGPIKILGRNNSLAADAGKARSNAA